MKALPAILGLLILAGCTSGQVVSNDVPRDWIILAASGTNTYIAPVKLGDGTRCVVSINTRGTGIACNWEKTQ